MPTESRRSSHHSPKIVFQALQPRRGIPVKDWDAGQYLKFEDERTRPSIDLLNRVPLKEPRNCVDLGCGPGNSTELIVKRFPSARVLGLDNSPDMLSKARGRLPDLTFEEADVATWQPNERFDLIFANAVLQWLPDHSPLLERLVSLLTTADVLPSKCRTTSRAIPSSHAAGCAGGTMGGQARLRRQGKRGDRLVRAIIMLGCRRRVVRSISGRRPMFTLSRMLPPSPNGSRAQA